MNKIAENNKRIAKNTLMLYIRMILVMVISLFTTRIVLDVLGVVDYGIYNVVGGIVVMFSFLSSVMASASQRFFAFELGRKDIIQLKKTFSTTLAIYIIIILIIIALAETIGLWFLNNKMDIPNNRIIVANWVYQFSILSFVFTIIAVPYNAMIVAHEKMNIYAVIGVIEVVLKLATVSVLYFVVYDKLLVYGALFAFSSFAIATIYVCYGLKKYEACQLKLIFFDKKIFKVLIGYSGWNLFGALSGVALNQGVNILLNVFFGPVVNAARGIAYQLSAALNQVVLNFFKAFQPQITKYYAAEEKGNMFKLVFRGSKFSFYLLYIITTPLFIGTEFFLSLWLKEVPEYTVLFTQLVLMISLVDSLSYPLQTSAQATGNIKWYQIVVGSMLLLNLPISYLFMKLGYEPQVTMIIALIISSFCLCLRLLMLNYMVNFPVVSYIKSVIFPIGLVIIGGSVIYRFHCAERFISIVLWSFISLVTTFLIVCFVGLDKSEKNFLTKLLRVRSINNEE